MRAALIALVVVLAVWVVAVVALAVAGRGTAAREIASLLPNLAALLRGLVRDPRVPRRTKLLLFAGAAWIASPIDLIPEFIPVLGPLDDVIIAALTLRAVVRSAGREVVADHWRGNAELLDRLLGSR